MSIWDLDLRDYCQPQQGGGKGEWIVEMDAKQDVPMYLYVAGKLLQKISCKIAFDKDIAVTLQNGLVVLVPNHLTVRRMSNAEIKELQRREVFAPLL